MRNLPPADELAQIRDDMRRLKIREAVLRRIVLDDPELRDGIISRVVVRVQKRRSLDLTALPDFIRNDRRYWTMSDTQVILVESRGGSAAPTSPTQPPVNVAWNNFDDTTVTAPF